MPRPEPPEPPRSVSNQNGEETAGAPDPATAESGREPDHEPANRESARRGTPGGAGEGSQATGNPDNAG